ncbi:MAG: tetratricopeptide repeat protein [Bacteroidetes bacterium]|nr:tetratricopeptide repeat protein [Bacteroidota bacterium]
MKSKYTYILQFFVAFILLSGCKTNKNTFIHRGYHNLTARYNGYYYATESIKEGEEKIRANYKYDYDRILPVFLIPNNESAKATFPEFDKAIKKSSNCIQRHTIKDKKKGTEITTAGRWIDNNWNVIGISHFYKREFFSGIEAFEYVIRSYKSRDKYKAMIWLAKSYNELGAPSQAEPIIGLLKEDKKISKYAKKELPAVQADYYIKRGMYKEAEAALLNALKGGDTKKDNAFSKFITRIKGRPSKKTRARYSFILAQLYEEKKENRKAIQFYKKVISLKPDYELVFHAKMKQARLADVSSGNVAKLKRDLLKMTRDVKNTEYLDIIYYTLGEISEKEKNEEMAFTNYQLSVKNSTQNPKQKALSYLKLGELSFEQANYTAAGGYYDSTMITLPKDYKDYQVISKRKETLETLIGYIRTIQREDSLQRIAKMSESERTRFIEKMIDKIAADEERKKEEAEALAAQGSNSSPLPNNGLPSMSTGVKGDWYFYNQTTLSFGINDFIKKWGNRKLEDNWRRSQKALAFESQTSPATNDSTKQADGGNGKNPKNSSASSTKKSIDSYLKDLPLSDSLLKKSDKIIIDAYYNLASTYKEELNNNKKAIATYEELNKRYADHKYRMATYFQLYRIFTSVKNQSQADYYKNKLFDEYPNSEYVQIIKNPKYIADKNAQKGEVELFYTDTYNEYSSGNYSAAYNKANESETKFGKNDFAGKFAFIKAMCIGKLKGADSLESALKNIQVLYPKDPVSTQAQNILEVLYNLKHPADGTSADGAVNNTDTFSLNLNAEHFVIAICPDDAPVANAFKASLADYNNNFYSNADLNISSSLFGNANQITTIKTFKNAQEALQYIDDLKKDKTVFSGKVKVEFFTLMAISADNLPRFYKKKQVSYYQPFFEDHYKLQK